jgi:hypothetical protein
MRIDMARIVYTDRERAAPYVRFQGVDFAHGEEVEVEERHGELLAMADANPFFEVRHGSNESRDGGDAPKATPASRGALAAASGKPRVAPLSYRGKSQEAEWLTGYDSARRKQPR